MSGVMAAKDAFERGLGKGRVLETSMRYLDGGVAELWTFVFTVPRGGTSIVSMPLHATDDMGAMLEAKGREIAQEEADHGNS